MKLTTTTITRTLVLSLALTALGGSVVATAGPPHRDGGAATAGATSTTDGTASSTRSNATSTATNESSGGSSVCESTVVVTIDGRHEARTTRSSGASCSTSVELGGARSIVSGSVGATGVLTAARARRLARAVLGDALGRPRRGRIRCSSPAAWHMTCTADGPQGRPARPATRRTDPGGTTGSSWMATVVRG